MPIQAMQTGTMTLSERVVAFARAYIWPGMVCFSLLRISSGRSSFDQGWIRTGKKCVWTDEAFLDGAIRISNPCEVRMIPRNSERLLVKSTRERATKGYVMRGLTVTESEAIAVNEKL